MLEAATIENRLDRIVSLYDKVNDLTDKLPDNVSNNITQKIQDYMKEDEDLGILVDGIKNRRPPRFIMVGRTGVGKSSLINAMMGKYAAEESDVVRGTTTAKPYSYKFMGKTIFEVLDTRGIGESENDTETAENVLKTVIADFSPDAILYLVEGRAYVKQDLELIKLLNTTLNVEIPTIAITAQVDNLQENREKDPAKYSERKKSNIQKSVELLTRTLKENGVKFLDVVPVSSYIEWNHNPEDKAKEDYVDLKISFDGRYNIDKLLDLLENNIDIKAGIYLLLCSRIDKLIRKISSKLTKIFSGISAAIALTPIPLSDIYILTSLQAILIMLIAYLSGRDMTFDTAKELMVAIGGSGVAGIGFRSLFQQGSKLANIVYPGAGSVISSTIAYRGTEFIGNRAIAYFIKETTVENARKSIPNGEQANTA